MTEGFGSVQKLQLRIRILETQNTDPEHWFKLSRKDPRRELEVPFLYIYAVLLPVGVH
jgi:hypothetical protein